LLPGQLTPRLQESVVRLGTWMPLAQAAEMLGFFTGVTIATATVRRTTEGAGVAYEAVQAAAVGFIAGELPCWGCWPPGSGAVLQPQTFLRQFRLFRSGVFFDERPQDASPLDAIFDLIVGVPRLQEGAWYLWALRKIAYQALELANGGAVVFGAVQRFSEVVLGGVGDITVGSLFEVGAKALCGQVEFAALVVAKGGLVEALSLGRA
jgi:hypothetical protein